MYGKTEWRGGQAVEEVNDSYARSHSKNEMERYCGHMVQSAAFVKEFMVAVKHY